MLEAAFIIGLLTGLISGMFLGSLALMAFLYGLTWMFNTSSDGV